MAQSSDGLTLRRADCQCASANPVKASRCDSTYSLPLPQHFSIASCLSSASSLSSPPNSSASSRLTERWNGLEKLIDKVVGIALKGFSEIGKAWQKVRDCFGMGEDEIAKAESEAKPVTPASPAQDMTYDGQVQLQAAASNPIVFMTSNAISNSCRQVSQLTDVLIDNIELQT